MFSRAIKPSETVILVVAILAGLTGMGVILLGSSPIGRENPPKKEDYGRDFTLAVRELQSGGSNSYIGVSIPEYLDSNGVNIFTLSRLYRDRLEFYADTRLRGTQNWNMLEGLGRIHDQAGAGPIYKFGTLDPCAVITNKDRPLPNMRQEYNGKICLDGNRLVVEESVYVESRGDASDLQVVNGIYRRGKWGGCIMGEGTERWYVVPRQ